MAIASGPAYFKLSSDSCSWFFTWAPTPGKIPSSGARSSSPACNYQILVLSISQMGINILQIFVRGTYWQVCWKIKALASLMKPTFVRTEQMRKNKAVLWFTQYRRMRRSTLVATWIRESLFGWTAFCVQLFTSQWLYIEVSLWSFKVAKPAGDSKETLENRCNEKVLGYVATMGFVLRNWKNAPCTRYFSLEKIFRRTSWRRFFSKQIKY